jgi:hypothetical protein
MNSRRVTLLFIAALLVVAGAIWLSSQRHLDRDVAVGQALLPDLKKELNGVTEIRLAKGDGTHTTLKKSGGDWTVAERNFAADAGRVRKLLLDVSALKVEEGKTADPARYSAIGVEDVAPLAADAAVAPKPAKDPYDFTKPLTATRVDIVTPAKTWGILAGKSAGSKSSYVRVQGAKQSFMASPRLDLDYEPQRWLDRTVVDIPNARIQRVEVQPAKGPKYVVSREKREQENFTVDQIPPKRKLSYETAPNVLANGLESISLDDVRAKSDAPAAPPPPGQTVELSRAVFNTFDGVTVEIAGRKESAPGIKKDDPKIEKCTISLSASSTDKATQPEAQKLAARLTGREFEISSYKYDAIFKPLEELLEAPATTAKSK